MSLATPARPGQVSEMAPGSSSLQAPMPVQPQEDEIEFQKRLMREKTELARKRRLEDEAREEAERRARIQKKLDALGPPPEKKSDKKEIMSKDPASKSATIQSREPSSATTDQSSGHSRQKESPADATTHQASSKTSGDSPPAQTSKHEEPIPRRASHGQDAKQADLLGRLRATP